MAAQLAVWLPVITGILAVAFAAAGYFLLLVPKIGPLMAGGEYDFTTARAQIADDEAYVGKMKNALTAFAKIDAEQKLQVASIMPTEADIPGLFVQLDDIARSNKMLLRSIDTAVDEKNVSPLGRKTVRISIGVEGGTYDQFKVFLTDIERSMRIFDVQQVMFTPPGGNYGLVLRTYFIDKKAAAAAKK